MQKRNIWIATGSLRVRFDTPSTSSDARRGPCSRPYAAPGWASGFGLFGPQRRVGPQRRQR
ncbi:hypothetical protein [Arthrobacter sp. H20]|uniref:hypothetical protein n=1 Tax=Arthrobacter sp. H20 TaxID=1267981 RepID=UPI0004B1EBB7|nr:hypothetical protein [Arthrobacter sp. H20]